MVIEIRNRMRNQPAPPHIVRHALTEPDQGTGRRWLTLLDDEQTPRISGTESNVVWLGFWLKRPDARIEFELQGGSSGTDLRWRLDVDEPAPDDALIGHMRSDSTSSSTPTFVTHSETERPLMPRGVLDQP